MASAIKKVIPMYNRVLVKRMEDEMITKGGIHLPKALRKEKIGKVLAKGPGTINPITGILSPIGVEVGDLVVLPEYDGIAVEVEKKNLEIYSESELLAQIKEDVDLD